MKFEYLCGDSKKELQFIQDNSIQMTVTSPPYYKLRNYTHGAEHEIGREPELQDYIENLVSIFEVIKEKTKNDGLLFLNMGDTYRNDELLGVPWRVALALKDQGWILRSDIIWKKPNAMPSSVKNRPTVDHEYVFMFAKTKHYYYDQDAIREPHITFTPQSKMRGGRNHFGIRNGTPEEGKNGGNKNLHDGRWDQAFNPLGRNKRTVWEIPLSKFRGAHFAVFPEQLVETCVLAGSSDGSIVCDPFMGSGTTGVVCKRLGRDFVGCDICKEYVEMAKKRIEESPGKND